MRLNSLAWRTLALALAVWPTRGIAQPPRAAPADSAWRLDSLAAALNVWDEPTAGTRRRAGQLWTEAAALYREIRDSRREATMLIRAGRAEPDSAATRLRDALSVARDARDRTAEGEALLWLAAADVRAGRPDSALVLLRRAALLVRDGHGLGGSDAHAWALYYSGRAHIQLDRPDSADAYFRESLRVARAGGHRAPAALATSGVGEVHRQRGRPDSAMAHFRDALRITREAGHLASDHVLFAAIANAHDATGRPDSANVHRRQALAAARLGGERMDEGLALTSLAVAYRNTFDRDSAMAYLREAVRVARELGERWPGRGWVFAQAASVVALYTRDSADAYVQEALAIARTLSDHRLLAAALRRRGGLLEATHPDSALAYYRRVLPDLPLREQPELLASIGWTLTQVGHPDSAGAYYRRAAETARGVGGRAAEADVWFDLTARYGRVHPDSALTYAHRTADIARELGNHWSRGPFSLYRLAQRYWQAGQLDSATRVYHEVIRAARVATPPSRVELSAMNDLGNIHAERGQYDSAFFYLHDALNRERAAGGNGALHLQNIGTVHWALGRPDSAVYYYREVLTAMRRRGPVPNRAYELYLIGGAMLAAGQLDSAIVYLRQAVTVRGLPDRDGASALFDLGAAQFRVGQVDSGLAAMQRGLALSRSLGFSQRVADLSTTLGAAYVSLGRRDSAVAVLDEGLRVARASGFSVPEADALRHLGDLHARRRDAAGLRRAVAYYDSAAARRAAVMDRAGADMRRVSFAEAGVELVERWALAWLARAPEVGRDSSYLAAFAIAERGRAQGLRELLRRGVPRDSARTAATRGPPPTRGDDVVAEGQQLVNAIRAAGAPVLTYLATKDTLLTWLVLASGEVLMNRQAVSRDSAARLVADFRAQLGVDEMDTRARALLAEDDATDATPADRGAVTARARTARTRTGTPSVDALADVLLPPSLARRLPASGQLVVIPQGALALAPFVALRPGARRAGAVRRERLGERYAIRYAPSLSTLQATGPSYERADMRPAGNTRGGRRNSALVVGNPVMPSVRLATGRTVGLPVLPSAAREGQWVARALGVAALTGVGATEQAVLARMGDASVVHLATHGFAYSSDARALDSFIALAPDSANGRTGNGLLTVGEILDGAPRLLADLVVLSACQTALGNLKQAEGTVGLQRAFLAKGARSVLVSLWSVSDEATELLMRRFYTHWLKDPDAPAKAEALRRAQQDVRAVPRFREPRYWAAFQLVGAT